MRNNIAVSGLVMAILLFCVVAAQTAPHLSGVWTGGGGAGAASGATSQWGAKPIPFTPAGLAKFNTNKPGKGPRQGPPALGNDPIGDSNPPGLYRTLVYGQAL